MITWLALVVAAPVVIENARVEIGDGRVLERGSVAFDKGRLTYIGATAPKGGTRIDGAGKTVSPGLIETRSQLGLIEVELENSTLDFEYKHGALRPAFRAADGFDPKSLVIPIARGGGITSAITEPAGGVIAGSGSWFDLTGKLVARPDPRTPVAMFGHVGKEASAYTGQARGGIWLKLRELFADTRFYEKNRAAFDRRQARALTASAAHLEAMIPVLHGRLPLVLEAHRASDILTALEVAAGEGIRLIIAGGSEAHLVGKELARRGVAVILTPSVQTPWAFETLAARDDAATLLHAAGVPLIISAGHFGHHTRRLRQEAGLAVAYGLPHEAAMRAITLTPARVFGRAGELGSLDKGKRANLVVWSGDPLEVTTRAEQIFIDGEPQALATRQTELAKRYLPAPPRNSARGAN